MARHAIFMLLFCLGLAACAGRGTLAERPAGEAGEPYLLDTGDKLRVTVFGQADLSGDFAVDGGGNVVLPLIAPVMARGRTTGEFQSAVAAELGRTLLRNPNVSVQMVEFRPFYILGEVQKAGQYPYVSGMTVQSAVAIAGGYSYRADQGAVRVTRKRGDRIIEMRIDANASVQPGDTILVEERYF